MKNYTKYICLFLMLFGMSFSQKAWAYTVSFSVSYGAAPSNQSGSSITLPDIPTPCDDAVDAGWQVYGWATAKVANNSSSASIVGAPGATYNPSSDLTLYAVYKNPGTTISGGSTVFTLVDAADTESNMPTSGYVLISQTQYSSSVASNTVSGNYVQMVASDDKPDYKKPSMTTDNANVVWEIGQPTTGQFTFRNIVTGQYLALDASAHGTLLNSVTNYAKWTVADASDDGFYLKNVGTDCYFLTYLSGSGWHGNYKTTCANRDGTKDNIYIYKAASTVTTTAFYVNFQIFYLKNCIFLIFLSIFAIFGCIV